MLRLSTFNNDVRAVTLSGLSADDASAVAPGDSLLVAVGKLQARTAATGTFYELPTASDVTLGGVRIDNATIKIDSSGAIYAVPPTPPPASDATPLADAGMGGAGISGSYARGDHQHPTDLSRYAASNPLDFQSGAQVVAKIQAAIAALIGGAPAALDTLKEIADQLASDESAAAALATAVAGKLGKVANLADLGDVAAARGNLGLGQAATRDVGTAFGTVCAGDDSRITGALSTSSAASLYAARSANLGDLANPAQARGNLGLGSAATRAVGTTAGTVAAGDDPRFSTGGKVSTTTYFLGQS